MTERDPMLAPFDALIGRWATEATHPMLDEVVPGSVTFEWLEGGRFLVQRSGNDHELFPDAMCIIGAPEAGDGLALEYFDSRGAHWVSIDASPLDDERQGGVALILQPASLESRLESLLRAFGLSEREREVAQLAVAGRSTKAIAGELYLSPWTVQDHLKSIFEKTSVSSRGALMALVTREASSANAPR